MLTDFEIRVALLLEWFPIEKREPILPYFLIHSCTAHKFHWEIYESECNNLNGMPTPFPELVTTVLHTNPSADLWLVRNSKSSHLEGIEWWRSHRIDAHTNLNLQKNVNLMSFFSWSKAPIRCSLLCLAYWGDYQKLAVFIKPNGYSLSNDS